MTELHKNRYKFEALLTRTLFRAITSNAGLRFDKWLFRRTTYSFIYWIDTIVKGIPYAEHLMLTTIGAKSGLPREALLPFFRAGDEYVVIGSNAGADNDPAWVANIRANPKVSVHVSRCQYQGVARFAEGDLRTRLFAERCRTNPLFLDYQNNTSRLIPVVLLKLSQE